MPHRETDIRKTEQGNVLLLILIAVFLFAALTYAVTFSSRSSSAEGDEANSMNAADINQYAGFIENAIVRMTATGGCNENTISFEHAPYDGTDTDYVNPNSPPDFSCHIFHPAGGAVSDREIGGNKFEFTGSRYLVDVGTTATAPDERADLIAILEVPRTTCEELNDRLDVPNPSGAPPVVDGHGEDDLYTGIFDGTDAVNLTATETHGARSFCSADGSGTYRYIHSLVAR